jgi:hypothetical protein
MAPPHITPPRQNNVSRITFRQNKSITTKN